MNGRDENCLCFSCQCGNICVHGISFPRVYKTGLSEIRQQLIQKNQNPLLHIRNNSVAIESQNEISIQKCGEVQCTIHCTKCGMECVMYFAKGNAFSQFIDKGNSMFLSSTPQRSMISQIPRLFQGLITFQNTNSYSGDFISESLGDDDDNQSVPILHDTSLDYTEDDFKSMFSCTNDPIVGSYTETLLTIF